MSDYTFLQQQVLHNTVTEIVRKMLEYPTARESPQKLYNIRTANKDIEDHMQIDGKNGSVESNNNVSEEITPQRQTCYHIRQWF
jgi:hypothetical protein